MLTLGAKIALWWKRRLPSTKRAIACYIASFLLFFVPFSLRDTGVFSPSDDLGAIALSVIMFGVACVNMIISQCQRFVGKVADDVARDEILNDFKNRL